MGFFSIIETFFFISLGITILLVALLVYHFKQRLSAVEQKYESLFDIVTGVVKQLSNMQSVASAAEQHPQFMGQPGYPPWMEPGHLGNMNVPLEYPEQMFHTMGGPDLYNYLPMQSDPTKLYNNVDVEEEEDESDESASESEDDDESESEDDGESSDDSDDDLDEIADNEFSKVIVSDDEIAHSSSESVNGVKIISLNVGENAYDIEGDITPINLDDNQDIDDVYELPAQDVQIDYSLSAEEENPIVVRKVEDNSEENVDTIVVEKTSSKDLYKKMNLSNLKATVIAKGLSSDPSKLKKNELLKLLEDE
jgi:hypothetical protein